MARWYRCGLSVAGPFVRRCLTSHTMLPFPHPAHRTGWADFPLPALGEGCMVQSGNGKRVRSVFVKSRKSPRDTRIDCEIPSQWNCYCGCANRVLLGHQSIRVTERHYAPWTRSRQEQLECDLKRAWSEDPVAIAQIQGTRQVHGKTETIN